MLLKGLACVCHKLQAHVLRMRPSEPNSLEKEHMLMD